MIMVRHYLMVAKEQEIDALKAALEALREKVTPLPGCLGAYIYQDQAKPERFFFLERWESAEAQKAGGAALGKEAFAPIMAALACPPDGCSLSPI